jgi:hypothetical protein
MMVFATSKGLVEELPMRRVMAGEVAKQYEPTPHIVKGVMPLGRVPIHVAQPLRSASAGSSCPLS